MAYGSQMIRMLFLCEFTGLLHHGDDTETAERISWDYQKERGQVNECRQMRMPPEWQPAGGRSR